MKVIHIIVGLQVGGAEMMLKKLIDATYQDFDYTVISLTELGVIGSALKDNGVNVYPLGLKNLLSMPMVFIKIIFLLLKIKPDVVQTWMYHADFLGGLAAKLTGVKKIIWGIRSTNIEHNGSKITLLIRKMCAYLSYFIPDKIICAANASKEAHVKVGYDSSKMVIIPNGFDTEKIKFSAEGRASVRNEFNIPSDAVVVGSVGRFNPVKNHKLFVDAALHVLEKNSNIFFLMVGRDVDISNPFFYELINKSKFKENFKLVGEQKDVIPYYSAMDIFCLHSLSEGFPNVLAEAMSIGTICISTDVGDASMLIDKKELIIDDYSPEKFSNKIIQMLYLGESLKREEFFRVRSIIVNRFSFEKTAKEFVRHYCSELT
jgi:glycosyltransferase involved in cell wall biosynthesis